MIVECDNCGNENLIPRADISYRCRSCAAPIEIPRATTADEHHHSEQPTTDLISEFIRALDQEIAAIKAGKGGSVVRVFDGRFIRETSGLFVYSFTLEDFIATVDDAPVEVQVGGSSYKGQIIQTQGLEVIIGVDHNFGPSIPDARLITNLYFLYEMLKKKFVAIRDGELSEDFSLPINVFHNHRQEPPPKCHPTGTRNRSDETTQ